MVPRQQSHMTALLTSSTKNLKRAGSLIVVVAPEDLQAQGVTDPMMMKKTRDLDDVDESAEGGDPGAQKVVMMTADLVDRVIPRMAGPVHLLADDGSPLLKRIRSQKH